MVLALTEVEFVPILVVQVWRVLLWGIELSLIATLLPWMIRSWRERHDGLHRAQEYGAWILIGVFIVILRSIIVQAERWDDPLWLEELPVTTVVMLVWLRARRLRYGRWF